MVADICDSSGKLIEDDTRTSIAMTQQFPGVLEGVKKANSGKITVTYYRVF